MIIAAVGMKGACAEVLTPSILHRFELRMIAESDNGKLILTILLTLHESEHTQVFVIDLGLPDAGRMFGTALRLRASKIHTIEEMQIPYAVGAFILDVSTDFAEQVMN